MALASRLAVREVRRRPGRTALVVLLVMITVAGITTADLAFRSRLLPTPVAFGQAAQKASLWLADQDTRDAQALLAEGTMPGATVVSGWEVFGLPMQRRDHLGWGTGVNLWTVDTTAPLLRGAVVPREGRLPKAADEVLLGPAAAAALHVGVGDTLSLSRPSIELRVVGIGLPAGGDSHLAVAPGYPVDQLRNSARTAVQYADMVMPASANFSTNTAEGQASSSVEYPPHPTPVDYAALLLGWLAATLVLAVLGIVVAAAFAASGRRQLVTLGQLGAVGADERFARRFLALQGSITGLVGAVLGVGGGLLVADLVGEPIIRAGRWNIAWFDLLLVVLTATVVATYAAVLPTRQLTRAPILTALAGRAPVATVRPGQLRMGVLGIVFGLVVLGMSVAAAQHADSSKVTAATALALASAGAILAGVCALSPVVIERWGWLGSKVSGVPRLAIRSLVRHRARSAALVAAIAAVGAVGVAGASGVERVRVTDQSSAPSQRFDVVTIANGFCCAEPSPNPTAPPPLDPHWTADVESVLGPLDWHELRYVTRDPTQGSLVIGDDATLTALGVPESMWPAIRRTEFVQLQRDVGGPVISVPDLALFQVAVVRPDVASDPKWRAVASMLLAVTPHPITAEQRDELSAVALPAVFDASYSAQAVDSRSPNFVEVGWEQPYSNSLFPRETFRWLVIAALLLLIAFIVGVGLALWAAEGRAERDQLVAVGAKPGSLAGMAGVRAWVLAFTGAVMAVPLGMVTLRVVLHSIDRTSPFPWFTVAMLVVVLPLVVAGVSYAGSAAAQRVHPVTGSTLSPD